jgi:hypothetical protein
MTSVNGEPQFFLCASTAEINGPCGVVKFLHTCGFIPVVPSAEKAKCADGQFFRPQAPPQKYVGPPRVTDVIGSTSFLCLFFIFYGNSPILTTYFWYKTKVVKRQVKNVFHTRDKTLPVNFWRLEIVCM